MSHFAACGQYIFFLFWQRVLTESHLRLIILLTESLSSSILTLAKKPCGLDSLTPIEKFFIWLQYPTSIFGPLSEMRIRQSHQIAIQSKKEGEKWSQNMSRTEICVQLAWRFWGKKTKTETEKLIYITIALRATCFKWQFYKPHPKVRYMGYFITFTLTILRAKKFSITHCYRKPNPRLKCIIDIVPKLSLGQWTLHSQFWPNNKWKYTI